MERGLQMSRPTAGAKARKQGGLTLSLGGGCPARPGREQAAKCQMETTTVCVGATEKSWIGSDHRSMCVHLIEAAGAGDIAALKALTLAGRCLTAWDKAQAAVA